jgi:hypothetical protein
VEVEDSGYGLRLRTCTHWKVEEKTREGRSCCRWQVNGQGGGVFHAPSPSPMYVHRVMSEALPDIHPHVRSPSSVFRLPFSVL